jgi:hypothetical protein
MSQFSAEFPVRKDITKTKFCALGLAWARGIKNSSLSGNVPASVAGDDDVQFEAGGETLVFKSAISAVGFVVGLRHEKPEDSGRVWRTEAVLTNRGSSATFRVTGQCIALDRSVPVFTPTRPYLIKMAIENGWGDRDGTFEVTDNPTLLGDLDLDLAVELLSGETKTRLPIVYVSYPYPDTSVNSNLLAHKLCGLAHVVTEPSRDFSHRLSQKMDRENPYGGTISLCEHGQGSFRRFYLGGSLPTQRQLFEAIVSAVVGRHVHRPILDGWSWADIQEEQTKLLRLQLNSATVSRAIVDELESQHIEILAEKNATIRSLTEELDRITKEGVSGTVQGDGIFSSDFISSLGREIYHGEFADRLRAVVQSVKSNSGDDFDIRTSRLIDQFLVLSSYSGRAGSLIQELKRAGKLGKRSTSETERILIRHGYTSSQDGKHLKLSPPSDSISGPVITLSTSPSDGAHGGQNQASDIANSLGLRRLS